MKSKNSLIKIKSFKSSRKFYWIGNTITEGLVENAEQSKTSKKWRKYVKRNKIKCKKDCKGEREKTKTNKGIGTERKEKRRDLTFSFF